MPPISIRSSVLVALTIGALAVPALVDDADARPVRGSTRRSVNRDMRPSGARRAPAPRRDTAARRDTTARRDVSRDRSVSRDVSRDVNMHGDIDVDVDHGYYHPVARAIGATAAIVTIAAIVGTVVNSLPPSCSPVVSGGITYQRCNGTYYQPQYAGTQVNYVVVNPP
jgi:hypothetical protein